MAGKSVLFSSVDAGHAADLQELSDSSAEVVCPLGLLDGAGVVGEGRDRVPGQGVGNCIFDAFFVPDVKVELQHLLLQTVKGLGMYC